MKEIGHCTEVWMGWSLQSVPFLALLVNHLTIGNGGGHIRKKVGEMWKGSYYVFLPQIIKHFTFIEHLLCARASLVAQLVRNPPAMLETFIRPLGCDDPLEKGTATYFSFLAWRIPWAVQSMGSQRIGLNWETFPFTMCQNIISFKSQKAHDPCVSPLLQNSAVVFLPLTWRSSPVVILSDFP